MVVQRPHGDPRRIDSEWTRVDPFTRVYPRDAWGFAAPGLAENTEESSRKDFPFKTIVLGTGQTYSQLLHRARSGDLTTRALGFATDLILSRWLLVCTQWSVRDGEWARDLS